MNRLLIVPLLMVASCGPKAMAPAPAPAVAADPAPTTPAATETPLPIVDASLVCDERGYGYVLEAKHRDGCLGPGNPYAEPGEFAPVTELELQIDDGSTSLSYGGPLDMSTETLAYQRAGCAGRVRMSGDDGALTITFAAIDGDQLQVTASWTPTGGVSCDVPMTGRYDAY